MKEKTVFDFDSNLKNEQREERALKWLNVKDGCFGLFGSDALEEDGFCRLTRKERDYIRPVNDGEAWLAEQSAGIQIRFDAAVLKRPKSRSVRHDEYDANRGMRRGFVCL